jgi:hypothetical protein
MTCRTAANLAPHRMRRVEPGNYVRLLLARLQARDIARTGRRVVVSETLLP